MLPRSNSTAADRLRRAKSTSSHPSSSSCFTRTSAASDPSVAKEHAEAAALEAYYRARHHDHAVLPPAPKPQRRQSHSRVRTEGSHFEDARLGRRRSTNVRKENQQPATARPGMSRAQTADSTFDERVVNQKLSAIPTSSVSTQLQATQPQPDSTNSGHRIRKSQSAHADGSPLPRRLAAVSASCWPLNLGDSISPGQSESYDGPYVPQPASAEPPATTCAPRTRERQTDEKILAIARDRCLQDFQRARVRQRKSFILAPFQRRLVTTAPMQSDGTFDSTTAVSARLEPLLQPPALALPDPLAGIPVTYSNPENKLRDATASLKGRIKKVFRRTSRAPSGLPPQQIEAQHLHSELEDSVVGLFANRHDSPSEPINTPSSREGERKASNNSQLTISATSETQSRVTSWTNSTVAATATSRAGTDVPAPSDEHAGLRRSSSVSTLRKARSFFGRPIQNKLRRASKAQLNPSEESQGLYSALRQRLRANRQSSTPDILMDDAPANQQVQSASALPALPSQQARGSSRSSAQDMEAATVCPVSSDPSVCRLSMCSPVPEVPSPEAAPARQPNQIRLGNDSAPGPAPTMFKRRQATQPPAPSAEQLQIRMDKSRNRWQGPLNELSPRPWRASMDENPYELRSLSHAFFPPSPRNDLPHSAKFSQPEPLNRAEMLSPSVYSRGSNDPSSRPVTPADASYAIVTITGHEVRSYSISPPKREQASQHAVQTSSQWRRWLSDEMHGLKTRQGDLNLTEAFRDYGSDAPSGPVSRDYNAPDAALRTGSPLPPVVDRPACVYTNGRSSTAGSRPRASSRRSSFMNERYPMVNSSRNSSDQSIQSRAQRSRANSSQAPGEPAQQSTDTMIRRRAAVKQRVVTGRTSIAQMQSDPTHVAQSSQSEPVVSGALGARGSDNIRSAAAPDQQPTIKANKHKSAFELRANFKRHASGRSTPLEIRRKPIKDTNNDNILEDKAIRNISAGPYAVSSPPLQASSAPFVRGENAENTPPSSEPADLPQLSSSEWLAAAPNKSHKPSMVHPAFRTWSVSRFSPPKEPAAPTSYAAKAGGKASPAQRMASEWLEKRSRENTPAFM